MLADAGAVVTEQLRSERMEGEVRHIFVAGCSRIDLLSNGMGRRAGQHVHAGWLMQTLANKNAKLYPYIHRHTHTELREWYKAQRQFPVSSSRGSSSTIVPTGSRPRALGWGVCVQKLFVFVNGARVLASVHTYVQREEGVISAVKNSKTQYVDTVFHIPSPIFTSHVWQLV